MRQVTALWIRRALDIVSCSLFIVSFFIGWKAALVLYVGMVLWCMSNKVKKKIDIWSHSLMTDAKFYDAQRERGEK